MTHPIRIMGTVTDTTTPDPVVDDAPAPVADPVDDATIPDTPAKVELTQDQLDAMIRKATARASKAKETEMAEAARLASMDDTERLTAERDEARLAAEAAQAKAHHALVSAEAKVAAVDADVKPDRVAAFLRIADLSDIEPSDDGNVDAKAIAAAVAKTLAEFPEFRKTADTPARGSAGGFNGDQPDAKPKSLEGAVAAAIAGQ